MNLTSLLITWILGIFLSGYLNANILVFILAAFFSAVSSILLKCLSELLFRKKLLLTKLLFRISMALTVLSLGSITLSRCITTEEQKAGLFAQSHPTQLSGTIVSDVNRYTDTDYFYLRLDNGLKVSVKIRSAVPLISGQHVILKDPSLMLINRNNDEIVQTRKLLGNGTFLTAAFPYTPEIEVTGIKNPILYYAKVLRQTTANKLDRIFDKNTAGFLTSLLSSDKSGIPEEMYNDLIATGTVHIIVVSGMHFHCLAAAMVLILSCFIRNYRRKLMYTFPLLMLFCLFTGVTLPVLRAFLMINVLFVSDICYRKPPDSKIVLLLLANGFLWNSPTLIFNPSFLLTFGATGGLVFFQPYFDRLLRFMKIKYLRDYFSMYFSVQVFTIPVLLHFFRRLPFISVVTNFFIAPLVAPILLLTPITLLFSGVPFISTFFIALTTILTRLFLGVVQITAQVRLLPEIPLGKIEFLCLMSGGCFLYCFLSGKSKYQRLSALLLCSVCIVFSVQMPSASPTERILITFFGAKNTNSAVITTQNNRHILYGTMNDIYYAQHTAAFYNASEIPLMILPEISNPDFLTKFLKTHTVGEIITPEKYREELPPIKQLKFADCNLTTELDGIRIHLRTDGKICYETEFSYKKNHFSFSSNADYIYNTLLSQSSPDKTLIVALRRQGKTADNIYRAESVPKMFSKSELHPQSVIYHNFSLIHADGKAIRFESS